MNLHIPDEARLTIAAALIDGVAHVLMEYEITNEQRARLVRILGVVRELIDNVTHGGPDFDEQRIAAQIEHSVIALQTRLHRRAS